MANYKGVSSVGSEITDEMINGEDALPRDFIAKTNDAISFNFVLDSNPYQHRSIETINEIRKASETLISNNDLQDIFELHLAGQTAKQLDVKEMNKRDMIVLFTLVTLLLTIVLGFQTKSVRLSFLMMGTIVLSYVATIGFSWLIFTKLFGYEEISYRIPLYTFVFMVALEIDYNIMLISRIKEFANNHE